MRGLSEYSVLAYAYYLARRIPTRGFRRAVYSVVLFDHAEAGVLSKGQRHCPRIGLEAIGADFRLTHNAGTKIVTEGFCIEPRPLARAIGYDRLRGAGKSDERVLIAHHVGVAFDNLLLLLADVGPNLIQLDAVDLKVAHHATVEFGAAFTDLYGKAANRVAMDAGQALGRADRAALGKGGDNGGLFFDGEIVHGIRPFDLKGRPVIAILVVAVIA